MPVVFTLYAFFLFRLLFLVILAVQSLFFSVPTSGGLKQHADWWLLGYSMGLVSPCFDPSNPFQLLHFLDIITSKLWRLPFWLPTLFHPGALSPSAFIL